MSKKVQAIALWVALNLLCAGLLFAQIKSGTILGTIVDSQGKLIPGVAVTLTNVNTNVEVTAATNEVGDYTFPFLAAGTYNLTARRDGFQQERKTEIKINTAESIRIDLALKVGEITETIEVKSNLVQLQTDSSSVQSAINEEVIKAVPNINSNPFYYATLQAGVVGRNAVSDTKSTNSFGIGMYGRQAASAISVGGGEAFTNDIQLDGVSVQSTAWNEAAVLPNTDSISEVRTMTNNFTAEYGRAAGVVQISTKSGTNQFHGALFDKIRNEVLNANGFENNARGNKRQPFKVNYYGASIGGPIIKDKAFFFVSWEGMKHSTGLNVLGTVPTEAERSGDFNQTYVDVNGVPTHVKLFDPFSAQPLLDDKGNPVSNVFVKTEVPNADIQNLARGVDPVALKMYSNYPMPNRTPDGNPLYNQNNFYRSMVQKFNKNNFNSRIDYRLGNKHSLYGTFGIQNGEIITPPTWGDDSQFTDINLAGWSAPLVRDKNPYFSLGDTIVFSPTLVLDVRYGLNRTNSKLMANYYSDFNYDEFGVTKQVQAIMPVPGAVPDIAFMDRWSNLNMTPYNHKHDQITNHHAVANLSKTLNRWILKAGIDYRTYLSNYHDLESGSAELVNGGWTSGGGFTSQFADATGNAVDGPGYVNTRETKGMKEAAVLMGAGAWHIDPRFSVLPALSQRYMGIYSQNDFRATSKLTINLGLRWDFQQAPTERYNRMMSFDRNGSNPFGGPGAFYFPGVDGNSRNLWDNHYRDFGPRVGAAYRLNNKTVLRGGFGLSYLPTATGYFDGPGNYGMYPFTSYTNENGTLWGETPHGVPIGTFNQEAVTGISHGPGANVQDPRLYPVNGYVYVFDTHNFLNGRLKQWNFVAETALTNNWMVAIAYNGSQGSKLPMVRVPVSPRDAQGADVLNCYRTGQGCAGLNSDLTGQGYLQTGTDPANDRLPNPYNPDGTIPFQGDFGSTTLPRSVLNNPYPFFTQLNTEPSKATSDYHGVTFSINHNFAQGFLFNAHYTFSKSLTTGSTEAQQNGFGDGGAIGQWDFRLLNNNRHYSAQDIPHRLVYSAVFELPFGKGKPLTFSNPIISRMISGWRLGTVGIFQSGLPVSINGETGSNALNDRPDIDPSVPLELPKELQRWYDGKTTVTLPSGRMITPCANCFLKFNPDAFSERVVADPNNPGGFMADKYYYGTASINYGNIRNPRRVNMDLSISRRFQIHESIALELSADMSNFLNHANFISYTGGLGGVVQTYDVATKTTPGMVTNGGGFGSHGLSTFDPRQVLINLRLRF